MAVEATWGDLTGLVLAFNSDGRKWLSVLPVSKFDRSDLQKETILSLVDVHHTAEPEVSPSCVTLKRIDHPIIDVESIHVAVPAAPPLARQDCHLEKKFST